MRVEWYYPETGKNDKLYRILVNNSGVPAHTLMAANLIGAVAWSRLAPHKANNVEDTRPGSDVSVTRGRVDAFVNLDDAGGAAGAIAKQLSLFTPYAAGGPIKRSGGRKKLRKGYGKKK